MVARLWRAGPPAKLLQPTLETDERPEAMPGVHAAPLMGVDERLDRGALDVRLVASGHVHQRRDFTYGRVRHVWAPAVSFLLPERMQPVIALKETGLVEYRFTPDSFEVRHVRAAGQVDIDLDSLLKR